jgi:hypothetical protein
VPTARRHPPGAAALSVSACWLASFSGRKHTPFHFALPFQRIRPQPPRLLDQARQAATRFSRPRPAVRYSRWCRGARTAWRPRRERLRRRAPCLHPALGGGCGWRSWGALVRRASAARAGWARGHVGAPGNRRAGHESAPGRPRQRTERESLLGILLHLCTDYQRKAVVERRGSRASRGDRFLRPTGGSECQGPRVYLAGCGRATCRARLWHVLAPPSLPAKGLAVGRLCQACPADPPHPGRGTGLSGAWRPCGKRAAGITCC